VVAQFHRRGNLYDINNLKLRAKVEEYRNYTFLHFVWSAKANHHEVCAWTGHFRLCLLIFVSIYQRACPSV